jgi:hypothetical protein
LCFGSNYLGPWDQLTTIVEIDVQKSVPKTLGPGRVRYKNNLLSPNKNKKEK